MLTLLIESLWFILPAYVANSAPVDVAHLKELKWLGKPIDGGGSFFGRRILGDGKTWRGLIVGVLAGTLIGAVQVYIEPGFLLTYPNLPVMSIPLAFMLSLGALVGDMAASFVKRRISLRPGDPAPLMDQLDFVFGALFFAWLLAYFSGTALDLGWSRFGIIIIITPFVHMVGNFLAWIWKLKKKPW